MTFKCIFKLPDQLKHMQGIERQLRSRRRNGLFVTFGTLLLGVLQVAGT